MQIPLFVSFFSKMFALTGARVEKVLLEEKGQISWNIWVEIEGP